MHEAFHMYVLLSMTDYPGRGRHLFAFSHRIQKIDIQVQGRIVLRGIEAYYGPSDRLVYSAASHPAMDISVRIGHVLFDDQGEADKATFCMYKRHSQPVACRGAGICNFLNLITGHHLLMERTARGFFFLHGM